MICQKFVFLIHELVLNFEDLDKSLAEIGSATAVVDVCLFRRSMEHISFAIDGRVQGRICETCMKLNKLKSGTFVYVGFLLTQ